MEPAIIDIQATQGDTFAQVFRLEKAGEPLDLSGATVAAELRDRNGDVLPLAVSVGPDPGEITLRYGETPPSYGPHRYDIEVTNADSSVDTWISGRFDIDRDVTNAAAL
jgi:hypothetical protein